MLGDNLESTPRYERELEVEREVEKEVERQVPRMTARAEQDWEMEGLPQATSISALPIQAMKLSGIGDLFGATSSLKVHKQAWPNFKVMCTRNFSQAVKEMLLSKAPVAGP